MSETPNPTPRKARLGRGLSSLITSPAPSPDYEAAPDQQQTPKAPIQVADPAGARASQEIPLDHIHPNPYQPRRDFDEADLAQLTESISRHGVLQPLVVAASSDPAVDAPYVLLVGERRLRASRQAGLTSVPCTVRPATPQQMLEWALVENIHRADLNPIERAGAYREYMDRFGLTQAEAAKRLGEPRATVANFVRLLDLPDEVRELVGSPGLTFGHAKVLAALAGDATQQVALARRCRKQQLSVRQLEALVAAGRTGRKGHRGPGRSGRSRPAYLRDFEDQLTRAVGTRVLIRPGRAKNTGRVVVDYYNLDDFDRVVAALGARLDS